MRPADSGRRPPRVWQSQGISQLGNELLNSREVAVRRKAAQGLGRASTNLSVELLTRALTGERSIDIRIVIVRVLRTISFQRYPGYSRALIAPGSASDDDTERDELVRLRATEALWEAGKKDLLDPVPLLERKLTDRSQRLRLSAVSMLRKHGSPAAAEALGRAILNKSLTEADLPPHMYPHSELGCGCEFRFDDTGAGGRYPNAL